jgi:FlaA1/EpsC-like NDP-sugar epimerase
MIQFSGKTEKIKGIGDIEIKIIGLRKGEKLYEELLVDNNSKNSDIKYIFQSIEEEITQKEFLDLYESIKFSYTKKDKNKLIKFLKHKSVKYKLN